MIVINLMIGVAVLLLTIAWFHRHLFRRAWKQPAQRTTRPDGPLKGSPISADECFAFCWDLERTADLMGQLEAEDRRSR